MEDKNPYANSDGSPKEGQAIKYFDWEEAKDKERLEKMTPAERREELDARKSLAEKMNS